MDWSDLYFLSEWAIRLAMLVYVPQRRPPAAARGWLLFIFVLPWPGLLLYAVLGRANLPKTRVQMQQQVSRRVRESGGAYFDPHVVQPDLPANFRDVVRLAANLGDFPILGGNSVELLPDYDASIERLVTEINGASRHVHLLYYIFANDATGRRVADALAAAVQRGVRCSVLIDGLGSKASRNPIADVMRAAGIEVVVLLPVRLFRRKEARLDLRNHRKIAVIDGRVAYVGSQNIVSADFKPGLLFEELVARLTGPVVLELQAVFLADRYFEVGNAAGTLRVPSAEGAGTPSVPASLPDHFPPTAHTGTTPAQVLPSGPGYPQQNNQRFIVDLLYGATRRAVLTTPYFIPDEPLLQALETATLRGVEVHLVVSKEIDQWLVGFAQQSYYEELLAAGVTIHLYERRFLHAKHISIDDAVVLIGSSNMDIRSFMLNSEVSLIAYDSDVAAELRKVQESYFAGSQTLTLEDWQRRSVFQRVLQNVARLFDSVL
jgi:cardiolipin synthase